MTRTGSCLCGAVKIEATPEPHFHACHCGTCRTWGGAPLMASICGSEIGIEGEVTRYRSSPIAERAFCPKCGTNLFYYSIPGKLYVVPVSIFDDQSGMQMTGEIYVDEQPEYYAFAGERSRMTGAEFVAALTAQMKEI